MPAMNNSFRSPEYVQETIVDKEGNVVGTIRVKPVAIKWKPKGAHKFRSVPLSKFVDWITDDATGASWTKS